MNKKQNHILFFSALSMALIIFTACSPSLKIKLNPSEQAAIDESDFSLMFSPTAQNFAMAFSSQGSVFDAEKIAGAFSELDFPRPVSVETPTAGNIQLLIKFGTIDIDSNNVFSIEGEDSEFFVLDGEKKLLTVNFNKEIVAKIISLLPKELFEYSDLMMAPILTGENISEQEYVDLISSAYGMSAGQELQASFFRMEVECPGQVIKATALEHSGSDGGDGSRIQEEVKGNTVVFTIPVSKMLSLFHPLSMEVNWK